MKYTEERVVPATTKTYITKIECDLCKKEINNGRFEVDDVVIECLSDTNYPEGGSVDKTKVDMCSDCFINKLLPWLESLGCKSRTEELDW